MQNKNREKKRERHRKKISKARGYRTDKKQIKTDSELVKENFKSDKVQDKQENTKKRDSKVDKL